MNIFCDWFPKKNMKGYEILIRKLNVSFIAYTYEDKEDKSINLPVKTEGFYIYENPKIYLSGLDKCVPLDAEIIRKMYSYEMTAMDLIYRWRTTLLKDDAYLDVRTMYMKLMKYWNDFLVTREIDLCFISGTPHTANAYMIYALCKARNIPVVLAKIFPPTKQISANTFFQTSFSELYDGFQEKYAHNKEIYKDALFEEIELSDHFKSYFDAYARVETGKVKKESVVANTWAKRDILNLAVQRAGLYLEQQEYRKLIRKAIDFNLRKSGKKRLLRYLEGIEVMPGKDERFVFFPLHVQPEASTCPNAEIYVDQKLVIEMISKCLPEDVLLYVKEHPSYWARTMRFDDIRDYRNKSYYDEIAALSNVRIIKHDYNTIELIDRSLCLITINGTAAWESIFRNKPVIMFGNAFFSHFEGIYNIRTFGECQTALDEILSGNNKHITFKDIAIFLKTMEDITVHAGTHYDYLRAIDCIDIKESDNSIALAEGIVNFCKTAYNIE